MIIGLIIIGVIYYILGLSIIYFLSSRMYIEDGPVWILIWGLCPFIWPVMLFRYINSELYKDLDDYDDFSNY